MNEATHDVLWRRLKYILTPQWDIYESLRTKLRGTGRVLEVGFGTGAGVVMYALEAEWVDAIEVDPGAVHFAQAMFPLRNVNWIEANILSYHPNRMYDAVVMVETLEHIQDWQAALENIWRLLKVGGCLIMTARNRNADLRRWKDLHEREWSAGEFSSALLEYFGDCELYDYSLEHKQTNDTKLTPLIGIARKSHGS